ncbi:MAG: MerR family transcriptional regulator [Muribaculaceae bacterium]|nr:MerR family transcriptional regulator [Muribaculaceae bacterium]
MESIEKKRYRISEVQEMLNIPASTLRFWESKFPGLKPARTGGGTRYYTPTDIEKIRLIQYLIKERGLKIEAAIEQYRLNPKGVSKRHDAIERLKNVRDRLNEVLNTLNKIRAGKRVY